MTKHSHSRRRTLTSVVTAALLLLGGMAVAIVATSTPAGAANGCFGSDQANTVTLTGNGYTVSGATPGVTFDPTSLPGSAGSIKWTLNSGHSQKSISTLYVRYATGSTSSSSSSNSTTRQIAKSSGTYTLASVTVCTAPTVPTNPPNAPAATCPSGQTANVVKLVNGTYVDNPSPYIVFDAASLTAGSNITWDVVTDYTQVSISTFYVNGGSTNLSTYPSTAETIAKTTSNGTLVQLNVCTKVTPAPNPNPNPNPNPPASCGNGGTGVQNNAGRSGSIYVDAGSPTLTFTGLTSGSNLGWTKINNSIVQYQSLAVYSGGLVRSVSPASTSVPKIYAGRQLLLVSVCTSPAT